MIGCFSTNTFFDFEVSNIELFKNRKVIIGRVFFQIKQKTEMGNSNDQKTSINQKNEINKQETEVEVFVTTEQTDELKEAVVEETKEIIPKLMEHFDFPKDILMKMIEFLPLEDILKFRETCVSNSNFIQLHKSKQMNEFIPQNDNQHDEYLTMNIENISNPLRMSIQCTSHDQGWASAGGSYTFGEFVLHSEKELLRKRIFTNQRANGNWQIHNLFDVGNGEFLDNFLKSKTVSIYLRSEYPGWRCFAKNASIVVISINYD
jgi:hypothetical protein